MTHSLLGHSLPRVDARAKVTGEALYPGDLVLPGMLHMKVLFAGRPHARIRRLDVGEAQKAPGVVAVFTARDVPVNEFGLILYDNPVLIPEGDAVRWVGDKVALVVAETERQAAAALKRIRVEYEDLPVVTDPRAAMQEGAPQLHADKPRNILCHYRIRKGDVNAGFAQADVIVEGEYHTPMQEHAYLQPEAGLAYIDEEWRVTVQVAGQWAHEDRAQIAHALNLPEERVRVIYPAIGGAFGGREDMSVQIILALAAWKLNRPVKIVWSREESIIGHHKRHQMFFKHKWGATRDGKIVAAQVECIGDAGAYAYTSTKVMGNTNLMCTGPYEIPNIHVDTYGVYTNNIPAGAFRGFGAPQGLFGAETQVNKLAEALGMDPVELRLKNCLREGSLLAVQTPLPPGVSLPQVIARCAQEAHWGEPVAASPSLTIRRGKGFAAGYKNVGFSFGAPEKCYATVELHGASEIEEVVVRHAGAEVGQGAHTAMAQMAAEAAGVPVERVRLIVSDTARTDDSGSASASRMTFMAGNAIKGAAELALKKWKDEERPAVATFLYRPPKTTPFDPLTGKSEPNFAYGYVAQAVTVEVDAETGQIRVVEVVSVNDVGRAVNPQQVEGQIEGAIAQAQGWALLENFITKNGEVLTPYLSTYLIPTVLDVAERVRPVIAEHPDPIGPYGARGMAEMPFLPLAPAIVAAVHDATGIWFNELPLTPERVYMALRQRTNMDNSPRSR
jgi:CO/xanthine dehydrogenase Mo-binding subunit